MQIGHRAHRGHRRYSGVHSGRSLLSLCSLWQKMAVFEASSKTVRGERSEAVAVGTWRRTAMIRKLASGKYRLYSRKKHTGTGKRRNLGTFNTRAAAEKHERAVQYFKHH